MSISITLFFKRIVHAGRLLFAGESYLSNLSVTLEKFCNAGIAWSIDGCIAKKGVGIHESTTDPTVCKFIEELLGKTVIIRNVNEVL